MTTMIIITEQKETLTECLLDRLKRCIQKVIGKAMVRGMGTAEAVEMKMKIRTNTIK
jgi:hypothetical protein